MHNLCISRELVFGKKPPNIIDLKGFFDELDVDGPVEVVVQSIAVIEVEFPGGAEPGVEVDFEFVVRFWPDVVFIEPAEAVVRFKFELPKWIEPDKNIRQDSSPSIGEGRFEKFLFRAGDI